LYVTQGRVDGKRYQLLRNENHSSRGSEKFLLSILLWIEFEKLGFLQRTLSVGGHASKLSSQFSLPIVSYWRGPCPSEGVFMELMFASLAPSMPINHALKMLTCFKTLLKIVELYSQFASPKLVGFCGGWKPSQISCSHTRECKGKLVWI
jgi:hypothetical protein